ncbi:hypothetical protein [Pseudoruegeria sp. SHC-113]|uniref:hypothetical protein n=1 Tax=Pseudoruegeria sp. SHC-113 TaxID=2855439 RepID=UPI0021BA9256|nr:hypothetical protein [Pseudoruegeria sp. SHC-113]MCT8160362.1 hypothetical protein [Pseudoruegeria sp. SHC-113]
MRVSKIKTLATTAQRVPWVALIGFAALSACDVSENEVRAASTAASAAILAEEVNEDVKKSQDFDRIANDAVADMDTSGLSALE